MVIYILNKIQTKLGGQCSMPPLQISAETAIKLSEKLKVPIEHLMHMPQHILLQKLAELAKETTSDNHETPTDEDAKS